MDRTKDLRGSRFLLFISFKKGHTSDIRPVILSSWLKQTILLCYKQADQQALDLVQVKVHDFRAFAASKAFYSGVSVDQFMQACHWKTHNTFTNFYLKFSELGLCKWDSDWFFKYSFFYLLIQIQEKFTILPVSAVTPLPDGWIQHSVSHGKLL